MRRLLVLPIIALTVLAYSGSAYADNLKNNVVAGGNDTIKLSGSSAGSTEIKYWIEATSNDGQNNCNAAGGQNAATVNISAPAGVSASPSSLTFTECGIGTAQNVTFSSATPGDYSITASVTGRRGSFDASPATFTLHVVRPNTAPTVAISGVSHDASYEKGSVPAAYCNVTDAEDGASTTPATLSAVSGSLSSYGLGSQTASCSYTDGGGLTASATATYSIVDTTAPTLTLPADITAEAANASGAEVSYQAKATDAVDPSPSVSCSPASGSTFPLGETVVKCTAGDAAGNTTAGEFTVTVRDRTKPQLNLPNDATVEATGPAGASHEYEATAEDAVDGPITPSCVPAPGSTFPLGATPVNCTATDTADNTATGGFNVTVQDTTAPALDLPSDLTKEATGPNGAAVNYTATAKDLVAGAVEVSCDAPSGATFPLGATTVSCTAVDGYGNLASDAFQVTVVDTTKPNLTLPDDMSFEATKPQGADVSYAASATDLVDGTVPVSCKPANGTFAVGATTVNCEATDAAGNTANGSFTVSVVDTTPPVISDVPESQSLEATGPNGAAASFGTPTAYDLVSEATPVTCDAASGDVFGLGVTEVTCSTQDAAGNKAKASFLIAVQDTTGPQVGTVEDKKVEATGPNGATVEYANPTAHDTVDGDRPVTCDPTSGSVFGLGANPVACSAADTRGNQGHSTFTVTVVDTTGPEIATPSGKTVEAVGPNGAPVSYTATAVDLVDGEVPVNCGPASGGVFPLGSTTVTCTAVDSRGNSSERSFTVTVVDTTAPTLSLPQEITGYATSASGARLSYDASASDLVDGAVTPECDRPSGSLFAPGSTTVNCTATDAAGNKRTGTFTVVVSFDFRGFLAPVDGNKVLNAMKAGSTAPIKWQVVSGDGGYIGDLGIVSKTGSGVVSCAGGTVDDLGTYATGGTALRYDATNNQYVYNWQSPKNAGKCYQVTIALTDGRSYSALFQLK